MTTLTALLTLTGLIAALVAVIIDRYRRPEKDIEPPSKRFWAAQ